MARHAVAELAARGLLLERVYLGTFLSALEMAGVSLSLLEVDDRRLERLDASTEALAWPCVAGAGRVRRHDAAVRGPGEADESPEMGETTLDLPTLAPPRTPLGQALEAALQAVAQALTEAAPRLNALDQAVGDGDLGVSLARGAEAIRGDLATCLYPLDDPAATLQTLGLTLQKTLGGTSGALYGIFFLRAGARLRAGPASDPLAWSAAFEAGCEAIAELGGARPGDRTMLDALVPAANALSAALQAGRPLRDALAEAAEAARRGAASTATMTPRRGRSSYLGSRTIGHPDPGAEAAALWLRVIATWTSSPTRDKG